MSPYRLRIAESDYVHLQSLLLKDPSREAVAFALAGTAVRRNGTDILVRRIVPVPEDLMPIRTSCHVEVLPRANNGLAALCEANGLGAVVCHSHVADSPYSPSDDRGEERLSRFIDAFVPAGVPTGSLMLFPGGARGRVRPHGNDRPVPVDEVVVVGPRTRRIRDARPASRIPVLDDELFDRQVRAFGRDGQRLISETKVGIVGVGGTGSAAAEQLARIGVGDFVLVDPQTYESTNSTRMYGTYHDTLRRRWWWPWSRQKAKVDIVGDHLVRIRPEATVRRIRRSVVQGAAATELLDRDIIFLCTDDHWGRSVVNQIVYQYLIPAINLGMRIASSEGIVTSAVGVVDVLRPDMPCLWCNQSLRSDRIAAESMLPSERRTLEKEGYVVGLDDPAPSVVSVTTTVAGMGVTMFLQMMTGFMGDYGNVSRLNYNVCEGTVRRGTTMIADRCICRTARGRGDLTPLPVLPSGL